MFVQTHSNIELGQPIQVTPLQKDDLLCISFFPKRKKKKIYPYHGEPFFVIGMRQMPPNQGVDRIGVSLGSHQPTVILKLPSLVEKKQTKVHLFLVLFSFVNQDDSTIKLYWSNILREHITHLPRQGEGQLLIYLLQPRKKNAVSVFPITPISPTPRTFFIY